jgi:hypothetical protein
MVKFSYYDKALLAYELRIHRNKFALLIKPDDFLLTLKEQFIKKSSWTLYTGLERTTWTYYFSVILEKKNLLSAYMENTQNGEKIFQVKHISVNNRTP